MNKSNGFTLIEVIIYIGLFSIVIGGSFATVFGIIESLERNQTKSIIQEEGDFMIGKINWAFSGAQSITSPAIIYPATSAMGSSLSLAKWDISIGNPVVITLTGFDMTIAKGANPAVPLNNPDIHVSNLNFDHANIPSSTTTPESVKSSFTLSAITSSGDVISQDFSTINYLRK